MNECWWGVSSFWWEAHLWRTAYRAIRERAALQLLSPLRPWLWKEDSLGQWSVYSLSGSNTQEGHVAFTAASLGDTEGSLLIQYHGKDMSEFRCAGRILEEHFSLFHGVAVMVATNEYFHYRIIFLAFKMSQKIEKCPSQVRRTQGAAFKCLVLSIQQSKTQINSECFHRKSANIHFWVLTNWKQYTFWHFLLRD